MDPFTGRVFALNGGFSFKKSEFNRATQAKDSLVLLLNHSFILWL